jgi:hypothetical protein
MGLPLCRSFFGVHRQDHPIVPGCIVTWKHSFGLYLLIARVFSEDFALRVVDWWPKDSPLDLLATPYHYCTQPLLH